MYFLPLALMLAAQSPDPFPPDFTPSPCAQANSCQSFNLSEMQPSAFKFYGLTLDPKWVAAHADAVTQAVAPACRRHGTCLAIPGNYFWFCDDVLWREARPICKKLFPGDTMCDAYLETYLLGIDLRAKEKWEEAQACGSKLAVQHSKPLQIWMEPAVIPPDFGGELIFFALDPDTRVPIFANITFEDQVVYSKAVPTGKPAAFYPFAYPVKFKRVRNGEGHTDLVPPMVTVTATGYPSTTFRLAAEVPKLKIEMKPAAEKLRAGKNVVTVHAHDASGKPVEARVMLGADVVGDTNKPIVIELKRGKRPEIWLTSLFDKYSDVVVAKGK